MRFKSRIFRICLYLRKDTPAGGIRASQGTFSSSKNILLCCIFGAVAQSVVRLLGMQVTPRSTPHLAYSFMKIWSYKYFYGHSSSSADLKKSTCQFMAKECTLNTGKLILEDLPRNSLVRITDSQDMISAVFGGHKCSVVLICFCP